MERHDTVLLSAPGLSAVGVGACTHFDNIGGLFLRRGQESCRPRVCRTCLCSAPGGSSISTACPASWTPIGSVASGCTTCPSLTGASLSWSNAARSWSCCSSASRTTGRPSSSKRLSGVFPSCSCHHSVLRCNDFWMSLASPFLHVIMMVKKNCTAPYTSMCLMS